MSQMKRRVVAAAMTLGTMVVLSTSAYAGDASAKDDSSALYFPPLKGKWERIEPAQAGWHAEKLESALELTRERKSSAVIVLYRGRIMAERYWSLGAKATTPDGRHNRYYHMLHGKDAAGHSIEDVASAQKSVVSALIGIAQHKGLLKISDPVEKHLGKGWSKAPREAEAKITLRHLITMTSGLTERLVYDVPAGTKWRYNTAAYAQTLRAVASAADMDRHDLTREWLTGRIGMADSRWVLRPGARERNVANKFGFATTARDLARFGLLVLAEGSWNGAAVIEDREYLRSSLRSSQELNPAYGYLWWLSGQSHVLRGAGRRRVPGSLIPEAPDDLVAAQGALGRKLYVVPSLELVITRLGDASDRAGEPSFNRAFWKRLMAAAPKAK